MFVTADKRPAAGTEALQAEAVAQRIRPVGTVEVKDASDPASLASGQQVFTAQCAACHVSGALGAPKIGDAEAWAPRLRTGFEALLGSSLNGKGQMPPQKGGDFTDFEIARAVVYLTNQSGAKFAEPAPPAIASGRGRQRPQQRSGGCGRRGRHPGDDDGRRRRRCRRRTLPSRPPRPRARARRPRSRPAARPRPRCRSPLRPAAPPLYTQACVVCHAAGVAGAPKLGDKAAWAPRIAQGLDAMTASVIKGKGAMPPRGGSTASDAEIRATVSYMVSTAK